MPPTNFFTTNKRPRTEGPSSDTIANPEADEPTPTWITTTINQTVREMGNLQTNICKKLDAIEKLEQHTLKDTFPPSMSIKMKVMVSDDHQERMNADVSEAVKTCQDTILKTLLEIRNKELQSLSKEMETLESKWKETMMTTATQMKEDNILDFASVATYVAKFHSQLKSKADERTQSIRMKHFLEKKKKLEQENKRETEKAQQAMDVTLANPENPGMNDVLKKLINLEKKIGSLQKNPKGKPANPKAAQSPKSGEKDAPKKGKKGKDGHGKGKPKAKKGAKPSTGPSGSKKKPSQKKQK